MKRILTVLIVLTILNNSCNEKFDTLGNGDIEFVFENVPNLKSNQSANNLSQVKKMALTIIGINDNSNDTIINELPIYSINGLFFSQKISLKTGTYKLTQAILLDNENTVLFAVPRSGSLQAQNVKNPLDILFTITKDEITSINLEVISVEGLTPEDFGLLGYFIEEVETFSFLLNVSEFGNFDSLLTASLLITDFNGYAFAQHIKAVSCNEVKIKAGLGGYTLSIDKPGFELYSYTFTEDSLSKHRIMPLVIELHRNINSIADIDGNIYKTVKIGNQTWMAENLRVTHFNDGAVIPNVTDNTWGSINSASFCWYQNDSASNAQNCGALYNWYALESGKLAPAGWRLPTDEDFTQLYNYLVENGYGYEGEGDDIGKSLASNYGWNTSYTFGAVGYEMESNNASGFSARSAGYRNPDGSFRYLGGDAYWWSSTESESLKAYYRAITANRIDFPRGNQLKTCGFSVRCIKNE